MSLPVVAAIIIALIVISLVVSSISYTRQKALAERQKQLQALKSEIAELSGYQHLILSVDDQYEIAVFIQKQLLELLIQAQDIAPADAELSLMLANETQTLEALINEQRTATVSLVKQSDEELRGTKLELGKISKSLDIYTNKGLLSASNNQAFKERIKRIQLDLDVSSHKAQAEAYGERQDIALYLNHLKQARNALTKSPLNFVDKNEQIKALSDQISEVQRTNKVVQSESNTDTSDNERKE